MPAVEEREIFLHGHRLAYRVRGDLDEARPVLLLVHGLAGSSATWHDVMEPLSERTTVLAPDLPGHGASDKPRQDYSLGAHANALRDLLVALDIDRVTVVGHSLGGGVAMQFAYQYPERCERLVLVSSGGLGPDVSWMLRALSLPGAEYLMPAIFPPFIRNAGSSLGRRISGLGLRAPRVEQAWQVYASLTEAENRQSFVRTLRGVIDPAGQAVSARDRLYLATHLPTLIVWGARDRMIPASHATAAHDAMPGSELVIFESSGHFPHTDDPGEFSRTVNEFVERTPAAQWDDSKWRAALRSGPAASNALTP